jgi:hypothetical protein
LFVPARTPDWSAWAIPGARLIWSTPTCTCGAPLLLGQDPLAIERHWRTLYRSSAASGLHAPKSRPLGGGRGAVGSVRPAQGLPSTGCSVDRRKTRCASTTPAPATAMGARSPAAWTPPSPMARAPAPTKTWTPGRRTPASWPARCWTRASAMKIWPFDAFGGDRRPVDHRRADRTGCGRSVGSGRPWAARWNRPGDALRRNLPAPSGCQGRGSL